MQIFGTVCEFDPLHAGHTTLLRHAKELGADATVAAVGGNVTQRGETAAFGSFTRAKAAIAAGADLAIELPYPFSGAGAERFGEAGVFLLSPFCTDLLFGSECGDIRKLGEAEKVSADEAFLRAYADLCREGSPTAAAYAECLSRFFGESLGPNDLLGVSYLRAIRRRNLPITPHTLRRTGDAHGEKKIAGTSASATALRSLLRASPDSFADALPEKVREIFAEDTEAGRYGVRPFPADEVLRLFQFSDENTAWKVPDAPDGFAELCRRVALESADGKAFLSALPPKHLTEARVRRLLLFALTGVTEDDLTLPTVTRLLALNETGARLLADRRGTLPYTLLSKQADRPGTPKERRALLLSDRADALFGTSLLSPVSPADLRRLSPFFANDLTKS